MSSFISIFKHSNRPKIIGMIHARALPGSPMYNGSMTEIIDQVIEEDGVILENMFDVPWQKDVGPSVVAAMTVLMVKVRAVLSPQVAVGVQLLAASNVQALAVANASGCQFIRAEGFVYAHIADKGFVDANAAHLLRERRTMGAENVHIITDIKKKHSSHAITEDISLADTARSCELFLSDGVIVTGTSTGRQTSPLDVKEVMEAVSLPVIVGSGVNEDNLSAYKDVDAIIVGSSLKVDGNWKNTICPRRVESFMNKVNMLQKST